MKTSAEFNKRSKITAHAQVEGFKVRTQGEGSNEPLFNGTLKYLGLRSRRYAIYTTLDKTYIVIHVGAVGSRHSIDRRRVDSEIIETFRMTYTAKDKPQLHVSRYPFAVGANTFI